MVIATPEATSRQTLLVFKAHLKQILISLQKTDSNTKKKVNPDTETVANVLVSQLNMNYEQSEVIVSPGFLAGSYWEIVKRGLGESPDDLCKFSREIIIAHTLKSVGYSAEEAAEILTKIGGKVTLRKNLRRTADQTSALITV